MSFDDRKRLMLALAEAMTQARLRPGGDAPNPRIPAGYTYLGQFLAHDVAFNALLRTGFATVSAAASAPVAPEQPSIDLASLYGLGPEADPALFEAESWTAARWRLALAPMAELPQGVWRPESHDGSEDDPALDLPRLCPMARDRGVRGAVAADPRNDANLLISQFTVLMARVHNRIADETAKRVLNGKTGAARRRASFDIFPRARAVMIALYHDIIVHDLLERMLEPVVWDVVRQAFEHGSMNGFSFARAKSDTREEELMKAFMSAAFRVGHAMVRQKYSLSAHHTAPQTAEARPHGRVADLSALIALTKFTPGSTPVVEDWIIEWDRFFFEASRSHAREETADGRRLNYSHLLRPQTPMSFGNRTSRFRTDDGRDGGVAYRDLVRNEADDMGDADAFIATHLPGLKAGVRIDVERRRAALLETLPCGEDGDALSMADVEELATRTPLILYILLEGHVCAEGRRLGPVGSTIIGGVVADMLVGDAATTAEGRKDWDRILARPRPRKMTDLLAFLTN